MAEIPQFKDANPEISPVQVASTAQSHDDFARTLGSLANVAEDKVAEIESDKSSAMYMSSVANAAQIRTTAQMRMIENPDQAKKISEQTNDALDTIKQSAYVNSKDRNKLNSYIDGTINEVDLKATVTSVRQAQTEAQYTHYSNWPDQLKAYKDALLTDHDKAEQLKDSMVATLHGLVTTGALTPIEASNGLKTMQDTVDLAQDHFSVFGNENSTAKDYHRVTSSVLDHGSDNRNAPVNESTRWLVDYHNADRSFQGVMADINNRMMPNPQVFDTLSKSERNHAIHSMLGVQAADAMINSGESFPVIEKEYNDLHSGNRVLGYGDQAKRNALGNYISDLKNGNFLSVIAKTPQGNALTQDFLMKDAAIRNLSVSDAEKNTLILQNKNNMVNSAVAYGQGHHMPDQYIQPIPRSDISAVEQGFKIGNDPSSVLQVLGQYTKPNQAYLAKGLKNPDQKMALTAVSLLGNDIKAQDKLDFIAAQQTGNPTSDKQSDRKFLTKEIEGSPKDKTLITRINANLKPTMDLIQKNYNREEASGLQNSVLTTTLRYAKYLAQNNNDIGMKDANKYIDQASKIYASSFRQRSGSNWIVNDTQLPQTLSNADLDTLANHVINQGYAYLKQGKSDAEFESAASRNNLTMLITPTGDVQAVDGNGSVYYSMPFTTNSVPAAQEYRRKKMEESKRYQQENMRLIPDVNP